MTEQMILDGISVFVLALAMPLAALFFWLYVVNGMQVIDAETGRVWFGESATRPIALPFGSFGVSGAQAIGHGFVSLLYGMLISMSLLALACFCAKRLEMPISIYCMLFVAFLWCGENIYLAWTTRYPALDEASTVSEN
jgi:hypothetical protein